MSEQQTPAWMADLPEDIRSNPSLSSFKGNDWKEVGPTLAKSFLETKSMVGRKEDEFFPKEDWKPEQWSQFHKRIGVPEAPDKYGAPADEIVTKAGLTKETVAAAHKRFHELGLTPKQVKGILDDWYIPTAIQGSELTAQQKEQAKTEAINKIKSEHGDKFDAKAGLVKSVLKLGGGDLAERFEAAGFGNDPELFKALAELGEKVLEDTSRRGPNGVALGADAAKANALRTISDLKMDKEFMSLFLAGNKDAVKKWNEAHNAAYANQK